MPVRMLPDCIIWRQRTCYSIVHIIRGQLLPNLNKRRIFIYLLFNLRDPQTCRLCNPNGLQSLLEMVVRVYSDWAIVMSEMVRRTCLSIGASIISPSRPTAPFWEAWAISIWWIIFAARSISCKRLIGKLRLQNIWCGSYLPSEVGTNVDWITSTWVGWIACYGRL